MKPILKRLTALILALSMVSSVPQLTALAAELDAQSSSAVMQEDVGESGGSGGADTEEAESERSSDSSADASEAATVDVEEVSPEEETEPALSRMEQEVFRINPLMKDAVTEDDLRAVAAEHQSEVETYAAYITSFTQAGAAVREQMKARQSYYTLYYRTSSADEELLNQLVDEAMKHTGNPVEGDYLLCQIALYAELDEFNSSYDANTGEFYLVINFAFIPYDSPSQERLMDQAVDRLLRESNLSGDSDYEKIVKLYGYVIDHVVYDYEHVNNQYYRPQYTGYAALVTGTAVCQGYSVLFYRLMLECGIDCRIILSDEINHAWNIVQLDGKYYNLDSTWDSEHWQIGEPAQFFLRSSSGFPGHPRNPEYNTSAFHAAYPMSTTDYAVQGALFLCGVQFGQTSYTDNGKACTPAVTVLSPSGSPLQQGVDYTVTYSNNTKPGLATVTVRGTGAYAGTATRTFQIKPRTVSLTGASNSSSGVYLTWKQSRGATNYILYRKAGSATSWTKLKTVGSTTSYTDTSAKNKNGTLYTYTVRPCVATSAGTVSGGYNQSGRKILRLATSKLSSAKNVKGKKLTVKWAKNNKSTGYQVQYSYQSSFGSKKTVTVKGAGKVSATLSKLSKGKTCYVRVRSYRITGGKTYYSGWSNVGHAKITR